MVGTDVALPQLEASIPGSEVKCRHKIFVGPHSLFSPSEGMKSQYVPFIMNAGCYILGLNLFYTSLIS